MARRRRGEIDPAARNFRGGCLIVEQHPLFAPLAQRAWIARARTTTSELPPDGWALVSAAGSIECHPSRLAEPEEWAHVIAHALLHLGFGHFKDQADPRLWNEACCAAVSAFLDDLRFGQPPDGLRYPAGHRVRSEERLYQRFLQAGVPQELQELQELRGLGVGGAGPDMRLASGGRRSATPWRYLRHRQEDWEELFARGLAGAVQSAVAVAAGRESGLGAGDRTDTPSRRAMDWFIAKYPLLGGVAAHFDLIEDAALCRRLDIRVAAVDPALGEVYVNPVAGLSDEEARFVTAHELLHVALRHAGRRLGRDPFLWNVACDYVVNDWLLQMRVGTPPQVGLLHDAELRGLSGEEIYDRLARDLRRHRRLMTFRGAGAGDLIEGQPPEWWLHGRGLELDEFYRSALAQGFLYHEEQGRGFLPAGLVEEIRALMTPPIAWDVELAHWFDEHFQPLERVRTFARPSRRQGASPRVPRPRWHHRAEDRMGRTFGVVLDTSMSMSRTVLGKALGAIASYAASRDVTRVRLVYVDAAAYDQGYLEAERLLESVEVKGRGGTVLQPAVELLLKAQDFPVAAPILVITDGQCDRLRIPRDHAFILPPGGTLPFTARGPVFRPL